METELDDRFHLLVGKICYAAAKADKVIKSEEIVKLNDLLMDYWAEHYQMISDEFYRCVNANYDEKEVINDVKIFKELNPQIFNSVMIDQIMQTAYKIVASFSGTNKSEIIFISQLRIALEK